jgi:tRNA A-37 threonylcarbamoyl transferase component Bud32
VEIEGYAIDRLVGAGAQGSVFLAREKTGLLRPVALKVFDAAHRADFERELAMTRAIEEVRRREHAIELVQALGSGEADGLAWIVLEYLQPGSLADLVAREGPLSAERVLACAKDVARALSLLHGEGLFHRDVKPANLLMGPDGRVRLGDFGLSRSLDGTLTAAGSPAFAAPEMIAGRPAEGRAVDIYSLGATLSFLLTGEAMLPGRPDLFALERRSVPRALQQVIAKAAALDPGERFLSIEAFGEALVAEPGAKSAKKKRAKTGTHDVLSKGGLPMPVKLSKEILVACVVALVASFMPWGTASFDMGRALTGRAGPAFDLNVSVWSGTLHLGQVDVPLWTVVIFAAAIAAIEVLRFRAVIAASSRRISAALAIAGALLVLSVLHDISEGQGRFGIGIFAELSAFLCVLSIVVRDGMLGFLRSRARGEKNPEARAALSPHEVIVRQQARRIRRERARREGEPAEAVEADAEPSPPPEAAEPAQG